MERVGRLTPCQQFQPQLRGKFLNNSCHSAETISSKNNRDLPLLFSRSKHTCILVVQKTRLYEPIQSALLRSGTTENPDTLCGQNMGHKRPLTDEAQHFCSTNLLKTADTKWLQHLPWWLNTFNGRRQWLGWISSQERTQRSNFMQAWVCRRER